MNGAPGVYSARFAGEGASDADNRNELFKELHLNSTNSSTARFRCVICYVDTMRTLFGDGSCEGTVDDKVHGTSGFGYDPVFTPDGHDRTFAQMSADEKHSLSHRASAVSDFVANANPLQESSNDVAHVETVVSVSSIDELIISVIAAVKDDR